MSNEDDRPSAPVLFNPLVSKILDKSTVAEKSSGHFENVKEDDYDNPTLSECGMSFCDNFQVISGVPCFILHSNEEVEEPPSLPSRTLSRGGPPPRRVDSLPIETARSDPVPLSRGLDRSVSALSELWTPRRKQGLSKFRKAAKVVGLAATMADKHTPRNRPQELPKRTFSMPHSSQAHIAAHEALTETFFISAENPSPILCCDNLIGSFRMVSGHGNGNVKVWDTQHGSLLEVLSGKHKCAVAACRFLKFPRPRIITADIGGKVVVWDISEGGTREEPTVHNLNLEHDPSDAELLAPVISEDGRWVVLRPLHEACDLYRKLSDIRGSEARMPHLPAQHTCELTAWDLHESIPTPCNFSYRAMGMWDHHLLIRAVKILPNGKGMCVSIQDDFTDYHGFHNVETGVLVWPSFQDTNTVIVLDGFLAAESPNSKLVVTWNPNIKTGSMRGACIVWDISRQSQGTVQEVGRLGYTPNSFTLRDQAEDIIHWCVFMTNDTLATTVARDTIQVVIWDVNNGMKLSLLESGIQCDPHVCSVTQDGAWLALYAPGENAGVVWNIRHAVQVLEFELPDDMVETDMNWELAIPKTGGRIVTWNVKHLDIWNIGLLKKGISGSSFLVHRETQRKAQIRSCRVSYNGDIVGMEIHTHEGDADQMLVDLWNLKEGWHCTLPPNVYKGSGILGVMHDILTFNFAPKDNAVVTYGTDNRLVIWQIGGGKPHIVTVYDRVHDVNDCTFLGGSTNPSLRNIVTCGKKGHLSWWGEDPESISIGRIVTCRFVAHGTKCVVLLKDMKTVMVWDLVRRIQEKSTVFSFEMRQMNKPPLGEAWPMPISPDGTYAVAGLDKCRSATLKCSPSSTIEEVKEAVGLVADKIAFSMCGRFIAMADFSDIYMEGHMIERELDCVWIMDAEGERPPKQLCGLPSDARSLAMSGDCRTVACVSGSSTLLIWRVVAAEGCLPDYYRVMQRPCFHPAREVPREVLEACELEVLDELLGTYGPAILNYPDSFGLSMFMHGVIREKEEWLKIMVAWAKENNVKICLHKFNMASYGREQNGLQMAINQRAPELIKILLDLILEGHTSDVEIAMVFQSSFLDLMKVYPSIFCMVVSDCRILRHLGKVMVPEREFCESPLLAATSLGSHPPIDAVESFWRNMHPKMQKKGVVRIRGHAKVLLYPDIAKLNSSGILKGLLVFKAPLQVFGTAPIRAVIDYKWEKYGRWILLEQLVIYIVLLVLFTVYSLLKGYHGGSRRADELGPTGWAAAVTLLVIMPLGGFKLFTLMRQFVYQCQDTSCGGWNAPKYWLSSGKRWFEIITLLLVVIATPSVHFKVMFDVLTSRLNHEETHGLVAVVSMMIWWNMLYYALPFKSTGPLVIVILQIVKDMRFFLVLGLAVMTGFSVAFFVLFNDQEDNSDDIQDNFGTLDRAMINTFGMMLGEFDTKLFYEANQSVIPLILWVLYMMAMMVVLLNLLIAIMAATFHKISQTEELEFLKMKARVIDDMESIIPLKKQRSIEKSIGEYMHIMVPSDLSENSFRMANKLMTGTWQKSFSDMVVEGVQSMESRMSRVEAEVTRRQNILTENQSGIKDDVRWLKEQLSELLRLSIQHRERAVKDRSDEDR